MPLKRSDINLSMPSWIKLEGIRQSLSLIRGENAIIWYMFDTLNYIDFLATYLWIQKILRTKWLAKNKTLKSPLGIHSITSVMKWLDEKFIKNIVTQLLWQTIKYLFLLMILISLKVIIYLKDRIFIFILHESTQTNQSNWSPVVISTL